MGGPSLFNAMIQSDGDKITKWCTKLESGTCRSPGLTKPTTLSPLHLEVVQLNYDVKTSMDR